VRTQIAFDDWRRSNPDFRSYLAAAAVIRGRLTGFQQRDLPECGAGIGIERVRAIVFGDHNQYVMRSLGRNGQCRGVERLGVYFAIDRNHKELAKTRCVNLGWHQDSLVQVLSCARIVVVISQNILGRSRGDRRSGPNKQERRPRTSVSLSQIRDESRPRNAPLFQGNSRRQSSRTPCN
jgi:hypothetical protein